MNDADGRDGTAPLFGVRVAVTGASGFVGRHLLDRLVRDGADVIALSRRGTGRSDVHDARGVDYGRPDELASSLAGASVVFHLAARAHQLSEGPADSQGAYQAANVDTAVNVAVASRAAGVNRFVLMSSIGVNGNKTSSRPFASSDAPLPVEAYARSKLEAEQVVARELLDGRTDYVVLRPPLIYGPGAPGNFDRLLRLIAKAPLAPLAGFVALRDFVSVHNLVDATVLAAHHPAASRRTFLICDGMPTTVGEVARILADALGKSPRSMLNVPLPVLRLLASVAGKRDTLDKLASELRVDGSDFGRVTGWTPPRSLESGLREMGHAHVSHARG